MRIRLIAAAVATKDDLHNHQTAEDQEQSVHKLSFIAGYLEPRATGLESLKCSGGFLLVHASVHLLSLLSNKLTLLLEEVFKVLLGLVWIEAFSLSLLLSPTGERPALRVWLSFS